MAEIIDVGSSVEITGVRVAVFCIEREAHLTARKNRSKTVKHVCCAVHELGRYQSGTTIAYNGTLTDECIIHHPGIAASIRHKRDGERGRTIRVAHLNISGTGGKSTCIAAEVQVVLQIVSGIDNTGCCRRGKRGNSSHSG